jgi:hypothetical protein
LDFADQRFHQFQESPKCAPVFRYYCAAFTSHLLCFTAVAEKFSKRIGQFG